MFGFMFVVGTRAYLMAAGTPFGLAAAGIAASGLLLMISIVNRGVASGGGAGMSYGSTVLALLTRYAALLVRNAVTHFGPLELGAAALMVASTVLTAWAALRQLQSE